MFVSQKSARVLALFLTVCLLSLPVLSREDEKKEKNKAVPASPTLQASGKLITRGNQPVLVNGYIVGTGTTILTGTTIQTFNGTKATVQLGTLGSFELSPNSTATLEFISDPMTNSTTGQIAGQISGQISGMLKRGCATLITSPNVAGALSTPDGMMTKTDSSKLSSVNVCVPGTEEAANAPPELNNAAPTNKRGIFGVSPGTTLGLLGAASYFAGVGVSRAADNGSDQNCCCCCCCNPSPSKP
jgi:hypothetical protein